MGDVLILEEVRGPHTGQPEDADPSHRHAVRLTPAGRRAAQRVARARGEVLGAALGDLSEDERETFERALSKVLVGLIRGPGAVRWMCRLCDMTACGRSEGHCPVARAARERYAASSA